MEKSKPNYLLIGGITVCLLLFWLGGYYLGITTISFVTFSPLLPSQTPATSPTPITTAHPTADWTTHTITPDQSLGYKGYTVQVPSSWKQLEHSSNFQNTETFTDDLTDSRYTLVIHQEKNYNDQTGEPYATLKEVIGLPDDVMAMILIVDQQQAIRVPPRAGSESDYKVIFFSEDKQLLFSIELDTPRNGSKVKEGEELFNQILSRFRFIN